MIFLLLLYAFAVIVLFIGGIITIIVQSSQNRSTKLGIKMLIGSVILIVIGAGACAVILANG